MDSTPQFRDKPWMTKGDRIFVGAALVAAFLAFLLGWSLQPEQPRIAGDSGYQEESVNYRAGGSGCDPAKINFIPSGERSAKADACAAAEEQHREAANNLIESRRAAIAAEEGAIYTAAQARIEAWGAALGLLTLLAAVAAAWFAKKAADHTETGSKAAQAALEDERARTKVELRPWLTLAVRADAHLMIYEGKLDFGIIVDVGNVGKTIASEVILLADFMNEPTVAVRDALVEKLRAKCAELQVKADYHKKIIFPGTPVPLFGAVKRAPSAKKEIYRIIAFVGYRDRGTGQPYETWATFDVFKLAGDVYKVIEARDLPLKKEHIVIHPTGIGEAT
jgi:hypothetical protein